MRRPLLSSAAACLAALLLAACSNGTSLDDMRAIQDNLERYHLAGLQYLLESGKAEARYPDLVGKGKYITQLRPANGESYEALVVRQDTKSLAVTASDGTEVTLATQ